MVERGETGLHVVFDAALDGPGWPGVLADREAAVGRAWLGPLGLLDSLETRLGLAGRFADPLRRTVQLAASLEERDGYWRSSFDVDRLAACRRLLRDRDTLAIWGWRGQAVSPRLGELHRATADVAASLPDRLRAVVAALDAGRSPDIHTLASATRVADLPPLWRQVFDGLVAAGTRLHHTAPEPASANGDLAAARTSPFAPTGDGSLSLLRRYGPLDTADEVAAALAAALAAADGRERVVIIGADHVLDTALARHGLPRAGAAPADVSSSAQLLRLVVEAAFIPMETGELHSLVTADPGPVPRRVARRLMRALDKAPSRLAPVWEQELANGIAALEEERRDQVRDRLKLLLTPACGRDERLPATALADRLVALTDWARRRVPFVPTLLDLVDHTNAMLDLLATLRVETLAWHEARALVAALGEPAAHRAGAVAEAGIGHLRDPGALLGPADTVVWWNFSLGAASRPARVPLTVAEREGLAAAGVEPPDVAGATSIQNAGWCRPLEQATGSLILCCPQTDEAGERVAPHPLWDDVVASLADPRLSSVLTSAEVVAPARASWSAVAARPLVMPAVSPRLPFGLPPRDRESVTGLDSLLGCTVDWALTHHGKLYPGLAAAPDDASPSRLSTIVHNLLAEVLGGERIPDPEAAAAAVVDLFDRDAEQWCEALGLPRLQPSRAIVKQVATDSARELARLAESLGATVASTEHKIEAAVDGLAMGGRIDLQLHSATPDRPVVLDLKWGKKRYREAVEAGTAVQLAAYAAMVAATGPAPETAFFSLQGQELITPAADGRLDGDAVVSGAIDPAVTWSAVVAAVRRRLREVAQGQLQAPGTVEPVPENQLHEEVGITLAPPCDYCHFAQLCGREPAR